MVESELNPESRRKRGIVKSPFAMAADDFAAQVFAQMEQGEEEIRVEQKSR